MLLVQEMQTKTTVIEYFAPTRMAIIKKIITSGGGDVEKLEPSHIAGGSVKWYRHFGKVWQLFKKLNIEVPYNMTVHLQGYTQKNWKPVSTQKLCVNVHRRIIRNSQKAQKM